MNKNSKVLYSETLIQICLLIISFMCLYIGLHRLYSGGSNVPVSIDNSLRFYAGSFIALGFLAIWTSITIRKQHTLIFFFAFFIFMGGLGRLISIMNIGLPDNMYLVYLTVEFSLPLIMIVTKIYLNKEESYMSNL